MNKKIRLWTLGNLEHKIYPTQDSVKRLAELLRNDKGETLDIIWGPDIQVTTVEGDNDIILMENICKEFLESKGYTVTKV